MDTANKYIIDIKNITNALETTTNRIDISSEKTPIITVTVIIKKDSINP
ncbi:hypothetical protein bcgnr5373_39600 [Bacillus cereus]